MMPDVDGWGVVRRLRAHQEFKETPLIVITTKPQDTTEASGPQIDEVAKVQKVRL
jgi:CheY-like chemotaxis protein